MSMVDELHSRAMKHAEDALVARRCGDPEAATAHSRKALDCEIAAITELVDYSEPTYSILHRSAGTLALDCNEIRTAERMAAQALAMEPPPAIAEELRDLLEQVHFRRHLTLRDVTLGEDEVQMNVTGPAVGLGVVSSKELMTRVGDSSNLFRRIVERRLRRPFKERGRPSKDVRNSCEVFVSVPRAASMSVTLKLGGPPPQKWLPGFCGPSAVVDEFMDLVDLADRAELTQIRERIDDPAYFRNFVGLVGKLAPDGERIRQVGFTVTRGEVQRAVGITRSAKDFRRLVQRESPLGVSEAVSMRGTLLYADARKSSGNEIEIVLNDGKKQRVKVPEGMMNDIVRPMWDSVVEIVGRREGSRIVLEDIGEVFEEDQSTG